MNLPRASGRYYSLANLLCPVGSWEICASTHSEVGRGCWREALFAEMVANIGSVTTMAGIGFGKLANKKSWPAPVYPAGKFGNQMLGIYLPTIYLHHTNSAVLQTSSPYLALIENPELCPMRSATESPLSRHTPGPSASDRERTAGAF